MPIKGSLIIMVHCLLNIIVQKLENMCTVNRRNSSINSKVKGKMVKILQLDISEVLF